MSKDNGKNGNNHGNGFEDLTIEGVKALYPEMQAQPLFTPNLDTGNPGVRLITNDGSVLEMLKIVFLPDYDMCHCVAEALAECDEFLLNEDGKPNAEVLQRIEWIKYLLAAYCSKDGRFADKYGQIATGVLTNAMEDGKGGWQRLALPIGGNVQQLQSHPKEKGRP